MRFPLLIRLLHLALLAGLAVQLVTSEFMKTPRAGRTLSDWQLGNFLTHDWTGLAMLGLAAGLVLRIALQRRTGGLRRVLPWTQAAGRAGLARELRTLVAEPRTGVRRLFTVARTIQGVGLLLVLVLGASGWAMHGPLGRGERLVGTMRLVNELHETAGGLLWPWLGLHLAMALPALFERRFAVLDIFRFGARPAAPAAGPRA